MAAPIIILQLTISIVFFDSIWIKANKGMTRSLVGEIETLFDVYKSNENKNNIKQLTDIYKYDTLSPGKNPHDDKARFTTNECYLFKTPEM